MERRTLLSCTALRHRTPPLHSATAPHYCAAQSHSTVQHSSPALCASVQPGTNRHAGNGIAQLPTARTKTRN